jgi:hypothetical protein
LLLHTPRQALFRGDFLWMNEYNDEVFQKPKKNPLHWQETAPKWVFFTSFHFFLEKNENNKTRGKPVSWWLVRPGLPDGGKP